MPTDTWYRYTVHVLNHHEEACCSWLVRCAHDYVPQSPAWNALLMQQDFRWEDQGTGEEFISSALTPISYQEANEQAKRRPLRTYAYADEEDT